MLANLKLRYYRTYNDTETTLEYCRVHGDKSKIYSTLIPISKIGAKRLIQQNIRNLCIVETYIGMDEYGSKYTEWQEIIQTCNWGLSRSQVRKLIREVLRDKKNKFYLYDGTLFIRCEEEKECIIFFSGNIFK